MTSTPPNLPGRFALMMFGLCQHVAAQIARDRLAADWIVRVWARLRHIAGRVERLAAQAASGTVPKLRAGHKLTRPRAPARRPPVILSGRPGWLVAAIPLAAGHGAQLQRMLAEPEMAALLAAAPQLARILRPLCRALGVPPPLPPRKPPAPPNSAPPNSAPPKSRAARAAPLRPVPPAPVRIASAAHPPVIAGPQFNPA